MALRIDRQQRMGLLLASPSLAYSIIFFVIPAGLLLIYSFYRSKAFVPIPDFVLENYVRALSSKGFWFVMWTSLKIGFATAFFSVAASLPVAMYIAYRAKGNLLLYLILASWLTSYLVRIYGWRMILGANGLINSTLMQLGLIDQPLEFILYNQLSVTIALVHIFMPFTLLLLLSALRDVRPEYLEAARDLGAGRISTFFRVIVPMIHRGLVSAFMFTFILATGDYIAPQLIGGRDSMTVGFLISNQFRQTGNWPFGAAMAFVVFAVFAVIYLVLIMLLRAGKLAPNQRFH